MASQSAAVAAVIVIIAVLAFVFLVVLHPSILVSGRVHTSLLTSPVTVIFQGGYDGSQSVAINSQGYYSTSLPAGYTYTVTIIYSAAVSTGSNSCTAGVVSIPTTPSSYTYNPGC